MKKNKLWQSFLAVSISAMTLPAFVQGQTSGGSAGTGSSMSTGAGDAGAAGTSSGSSSMGSGASSTSGTRSSSSSDMTGSSSTKGSTGSSSSSSPTGGTSSSMGSTGSTGTGGSMGTTGTTGAMGSSGTMGSGASAMTSRGVTEADRTLNTNLHQALNTDTSLKNSAKNVHFSTDNGKVTLNGTVATEKEKQDIEAKVEKMTGVKDVDNQLQIGPTASSAGSGGMSSSSIDR